MARQPQKQPCERGWAFCVPVMGGEQSLASAQASRHNANGQARPMRVDMPIDYDDMMQSGATGLEARYDEKDVMLYALGVGFMRDPLDEKELPFAYEGHGLKVVPTFATVINRGDAPAERQRMPQKSSINFMMVVDGERRITFHKSMGPTAEVVADERMLEVLDKGEGRGAVLIQER